MIRKLLSLVMATATLYVYLQSQLQSADALFLIKSDNTFVNLAFVALAGGAVYLSFLKRFEFKSLYLGALGIAIVGSVAGLVGLGYSSLELGGSLGLIDYVMILQLGIIFGISCLSLEHQPVKYRALIPDLLKSMQFNRRVSASIPKAAITPSRRPSTPRTA